MTIIKCIICILLSIMLFTSCATYQPANNNNQFNEQNAFPDTIAISEKQLDITFSIIEDKILSKKYVGIDPNKSNMIPVIMKIKNNSDEPIKLDLNNCFVVSDKNVKFSALSVEEAIKGALRNDASVLGWTIGFGLVGGLIAGDNAASTNRTLEEDYHSKYFKPTLINGGGEGEGMIFFNYSPEAQHHLKALTLSFFKLTNDEQTAINIKLSDI